MLNVNTPDEVYAILQNEFPPLNRSECLPVGEALGRFLAEDIVCSDPVPGFDRTSVDGYAVRASDTFGCSESLPALLSLQGEIEMGTPFSRPLAPMSCVRIPTGGAVPTGADAVVMQEHTELFDSATVGILKPAAPGVNMVYRGDDAKPGDVILKKGRRILPQDIGALAALGVEQVLCARRPVVGILATGDELVPSSSLPESGQVRNVNSPLLSALVRDAGGIPVDYGIVRDRRDLLEKTLDRALRECDLVLYSGGSSAGEKDFAADVISSIGSLLFHGIAVKPGKPTILGKIPRPDGSGFQAVFGLPGHPAAAFFITYLFVRPLIAQLMGAALRPVPVRALLTEPVPANHGRAQFGSVFLRRQDGVLYAEPVRSKSGLIANIAQTDGFYVISSEQEGLRKNDPIDVYRYEL